MSLKVEEGPLIYNTCYCRRVLSSYLKVYNLDAQLKFWDLVLHLKKVHRNSKQSKVIHTFLTCSNVARYKR